MPEDEKPAEEKGSGEQFNELIMLRRAKLEKLQESGVEPYKSRYRTPESLALAEDLATRFKDLENGEGSGDAEAVAGRVMAIRQHGKASFADLQDSSGKIQLLLRQDNLGDDEYHAFGDIDIGDIIGASGEVVRSKRGELSIAVSSFELLSKAIRPLPEKWHGLKDTEHRFRQRYLDLLMNEEARQVLNARSKIIREIRNFLDGKGFTEVETPMLQPLPGGANARPFKTHHNALDMDLFMRIAPELYLKRLLVGGYDKVYELNRNFRNEGISIKHNPEFTMLEAYQAYIDYHYLMDFLEEMLSTVVETVKGNTVLELPDGDIDLAPPWDRLSMLDALERYAGLELDLSMDEAVLAGVAKEHDIDVPSLAGKGWVITALFEKLVEPRLVDPTIIFNYPEEISPLARRNPEAPGFTERFEVMIGGQEIANAFSELTDPIDQRNRFEAQARKKAAGDEEAQPVDNDFLTALEYGMPPAGGLGVGIDRLVMLVTGKRNIKEVIIFPHMRPQAGRHKAPEAE